MGGIAHGFDGIFPSMRDTSFEQVSSRQDFIIQYIYIERYAYDVL